MGTFRQVFMASKFSSIENANRKHKSEVSASERNGIVYVCMYITRQKIFGWQA